MLDGLQYWILKRFAPQPSPPGNTPEENNKLRNLLGAAFLDELNGTTVTDFGCGHGHQALEMARAGAQVIGLDIRETVLEQAREHARAAGLSSCCMFTQSTGTLSDFVISIDAFEHFDDPAGILDQIYSLLKPGGSLVATFGPTWYHPRGGHLLSVFPWAHLIFSEKALMRWRANFRSDGATRFGDAEGGLNQMTIRRFHTLVRNSRFDTAEIEVVPIRRLRAIHCRVTREWTSALVRARLRKA